MFIACCAADIAVRLLSGEDEQALRLCRVWTAEVGLSREDASAEAALAWATMGRCQLWMCKVDEVVKLPGQCLHAAAAQIVAVATKARQCKSRGNIQFQAGEFGAAEQSYSDGMSIRLQHYVCHM